jgi:CBS domain containing-hemolysin-like protein
MDPMITLLFFMILLSAFFSGMEIAFFSSNKLRIEIDRQKGALSGRVFSRFLDKPSALIATLLIGNNIALVIFGIAAAELFTPFLYQVIPATAHAETLLMAMQIMLATGLILVTAEFIPKVLFRINPNGMLTFFAIPTIIFHYLLYPVAKVFILASGWIMKKVVKIPITEEKYAFSTLDLDNYLIEFSQENEDVPAYEDEIQMIQNAIDFKNVKLRDCMVPRTEIIAVELEDPLSLLNRTFLESGHSKVLVYEDSIDNIIGYTHAFDLFRNPEEIRSILRPVIIVPESMPANKMMEKFIKEHKSIGVVVDEFGGTAGIITLEDVIEEIFGEIEDEFDTSDLYEKQIAPDEFLLEARLEIDYLNEKYDFGIEEDEDYNTLAGFILHHHEHIPSIGDQITIQKFGFTVTEASETRLIKVRMKLLS